MGRCHSQSFVEKTLIYLHTPLIYFIQRIPCLDILISHELGSDIEITLFNSSQ